MKNWDNWIADSNEQLEEYFLEECKDVDADKLDYLTSLVTEDYNEFCSSFYAEF